ncbi:hypothetical protein RGUI_3158 [Rhodovulum sp. P5]|nr:hypothetical protein RGUI_3158 [Rhodovulum sp. P5]
MLRTLLGSVAFGALVATPVFSATTGQSAVSFTITMPDFAAYDALRVYVPAYDNWDQNDENTTGSASVVNAFDRPTEFSVDASSSFSAGDGTADGLVEFASSYYIINDSDTETAVFTVMIDGLISASVGTDGGPDDVAQARTIFDYQFGTDLMAPDFEEYFQPFAWTVTDELDATQTITSVIDYTLAPHGIAYFTLYGNMFVGGEGRPVAQTPPVPLPAGGLLLLTGLAGFVVRRRG